MSARAIVYANGDVGVRCLSVLLAAGVDVPLVVAHASDAHEALHFASVEALARAQGIEVVLPDDVNAPVMLERVAALAPDFIFSFYCRQLLGAPLLALARRGAWNMHGSMLPRYRGRVPVNWAVIRGESETGATLHEMTVRADAGAIVDQQAVPILPDDTAFEVYRKVTVAAEIVLWRSLPGLLRGDAPRLQQDLSAGNYCGRRTPEDGRIDWRAPAREVHNLVRGVAPPYPGAHTELGTHTLRVLRTGRVPARHAMPGPATLVFDAGACYFQCADGGVLQLLEAELDGAPLAPPALHAALGHPSSMPLPAAAPESAP